MDLLMEGANEFLTKPCEPERIFKTVEHVTTPDSDFLDSHLR